MPYKDLEEKNAKSAEYRAKNRALLAAKERERHARMSPERRVAVRKRQWERVQERRAAGTYDRPRSREYARERHEVMKQDPEYRARATERARAWRLNNPERATATFREIRRRKLATDLNFKIAAGLRKRFDMALRGNAKSGRAVRALGCSIDEFRAYIERKFESGMSWENWSRRGWHLDHIRPLSSFDLSDESEVAVACHFSNMQPMWASMNISKGART